jgi:nucleotide-binding universal stress UspA family protein
VECFLRLVPHKDMQTTVVSVVPPLPIETESPPEALSALLEEVRRHSKEEGAHIVQQTVDRLHQCGMKTVVVVTHGHVGQKLIELAQSTQADLMVVGSRGLTGATRYLMGSVSDTVVKYAPCPVLVFRRS